MYILKNYFSPLSNLGLLDGQCGDDGGEDKCCKEHDMSDEVNNEGKAGVTASVTAGAADEGDV